MADETERAEPVAEDTFDALIDRWFSDSFHGSPVARNTETYNHVFDAKEKLKILLKSRSR